MLKAVLPQVIRLSNAAALPKGMRLFNTVVRNPEVPHPEVRHPELDIIQNWVQQGHLYEILPLLKNKDLSQPGYNGVLHLAARMGHPGFVEWFLSCKADPNLRYIHETPIWSTTPIFEAVLSGDVKVAEIILKAGGNANHHSSLESNVTCMPLHATNSPEMAELLLQYGAKVDCLNSLGETPLLLAAAGGHVEMVKILLKHNADATLKSLSGCNALYYINNNVELKNCYSDHESEAIANCKFL